MNVLVIVTFVALGVLVAALALSLITIVLVLRSIQKTAGLILFGVRAVADQAAPVGPIVAGINADLTAVRDALQSVLDKAQAAPTEEQRVAADAGARGLHEPQTATASVLHAASDEGTA